MRAMRLLASWCWRLPLWLLFGVLVRVRLLLWGWGWLRCRRGGVLCVSVGGLSVGGSGKTPLTDALLEWVGGRGWRAVCLSRGYGRRGASALVRVCVDEGDAAEPAWVGDEVAMLAAKHRRVPFYVGSHRGRSLRAARLWDAPQLAILDDAFQHLSLERDLNLLLWDARQQLSKSHLLPWGSLREPLSQACRAHALLLTRANLGDAAARIHEWRARGISIPIFRCQERLLGLCSLDGSKRPLKDLQGLTVGVWCGIAQPENLEHSLQQLKACVTVRQYFPDHHPYTAQDLQLLKHLLTSPQPQVWVTTTKDAVKLKDRLPQQEQLWVLQTAQQPEESFFGFLLEFFRQHGLR